MTESEGNILICDRIWENRLVSEKKQNTLLLLCVSFTSNEDAVFQIEAI